MECLMARLQMSRPVRLYMSAIADVPTVIGWIRPCILLPVSAITGLVEAQLRAILAHELAHIRRYDYLVNLLQNAIETLLFYHPAVWWVSLTIRRERENCCDDIAVEVCGDVMLYANALAQLEELRGSIPEPALAATGGDLVARILRLTGQKNVRDRTSGSLGAMLATALVFCAWIVAGNKPAVRAQSAPVAAEFETVSIRPVPPGKVGRSGGPGSSTPDQFAYESISLGGLVSEAFGVREDQIEAPFWIYLENYGITAKIPPSTARAQIPVMLQNLLADRFHLVVHHTSKESPGYELVVAASGSKLQASMGGSPQPNRVQRMSVRETPDRRSLETCQHCPISVLLRQASRQVGTWDLSGGYPPILVPAIVVDKTGLTGEYDFNLTLTGDEGGNNDFSYVIQEQLGLKLEKSDRIPVDVLVIDYVDRVPRQQ